MSSLTRSAKTKFSLHIIESLEFSDEDRNRLEGKILRQIFRLSGHKVGYLYIRTRRELQAGLQRYHISQRRYLHLSCHGNSSNIGLTLDTLSFPEFANDINQYLRNRRLFLSACAVVNEDLAKLVIPGSRCYSVIGPRRAIYFDDSVLMWAAFYHLMFRDPAMDAMRGGKIRWALRRIRHAFGIEFDYFKRSDRPPGYTRVAIDDK